MDFKVGQILIAKKKFLYNGENSLIVDKEYPIKLMLNFCDSLIISSEYSQTHVFKFDEVEKYFTIKQ